MVGDGGRRLRFGRRREGGGGDHRSSSGRCFRARRSKYSYRNVSRGEWGCSWALYIG
jgi:hypothetical protein